MPSVKRKKNKKNLFSKKNNPKNYNFATATASLQ